MVMKITLIVVVACLAQGFAQNPVGRPYPLPKPCKTTSVSKDAGNLPHQFEEAIMELDNVRETFSVAALEAYSRGANFEVIIACFREQKGNYMRLGQRIAELFRQSAAELAKDLGDKYEGFATKVQGPLRNIATTMRTLPRKMWVLIKDKQFDKALELMRESRKIVVDNAKILAEAINELREELPEIAAKAVEMAREIRNEARKGSETIAKAIRQCIENGGPGKFEDDADVEEQESDVEEEASEN